MFNFKWGIMPGVSAFLLALITNLMVGQASFFDAILQSSLFAALFFVLGIGIWMVISRFLPELLSPISAEEPANILFSAETPGARVNITVGDMSDAAIPGISHEEHGIDSVGNINDLVSGTFKVAAEVKLPMDMDQAPDNGYNETPDELFHVPDSSAEAESDFSLGFSDFIPGTGIAELDAMSELFSFSTGENGLSTMEETVERKAPRNKPETFEGDFNPKEIASGLRTVLERDKKG